MAPDAVQAIKDWRKAFTKKINRDQLKALQGLSDRIDALWTEHMTQRQTVLARTRTEIALWGQSSISQSSISNASVAEKTAELARLYAPTSAYRRLKLTMDYWCALWFWPIDAAGQLPTRAQYLRDLDSILHSDETGFEVVAEQLALYDVVAQPETAAGAPTGEDDGQALLGWNDRDELQKGMLGDLKVSNVDELAAEIGRLALVTDVAMQQRFHHWELTFAEVFGERGGFDLILGNPPWVKLSFNETGVLSEYEPLVKIRKMSANLVARERPKVLNSAERISDYLGEFADMEGSLNFLNDQQNYPLLAGMQTNLYKCFITKAWAVGSSSGVTGYLHPEGGYDDPKGGALRAQTYLRLAAHFQFHNELNLFAEVDHHTKYSVNIYRPSAAAFGFDHLVNLFHPNTVDRCYIHDGAGAVPGMRDENDNWEIRGHADRIVHVNEARLRLFADLYDADGTPTLQARLPSVHSEQIVHVLEQFAEQPRIMRDIRDRYHYSRMWEEAAALADGTIQRVTRFPKTQGEWIVSGPHFHVATPFNKTPNAECDHNLDYSEIDLTIISDDYLPRTNYVPACSLEEYQGHVSNWNGKPITVFYRHIHRRMLSQTGERTLINSIIPPDIGHLDTVYSVSFDDNRELVKFSGLCSSVVYDFFVKSSGKGDMRNELADMLPLPSGKTVIDAISARALRLNCLTTHYADLWEELYDPAFNADGWAKADARLASWAALTPHWQRDVALRTPFERRQALVEIDVLAALALDLTLDELLTIYRVQFPVLQKYERKKRFDQRGMEVPMKTSRGELMVDESKPEFAEMVAPFTPVDREADYRQAWDWFAGRVGDG